ncbi:DUF1697 domain-containing protein [Candidatus Shapirobacteria bacterium]|nr:DUF1697 domain-containing protein [Candidatus Shapirobacteria bacterium]
MTKYVALLRGINVGGNKKVEMGRLRKCFEENGYKNVKTYINSGNVIFESEDKNTSKLAKKIETEIELFFNINIDVLVRTAENIWKVSEGIPAEWKNDAEEKTDVIFLKDGFDNEDCLKLVAIKEVDQTFYIDGAIVWHIKRSDYGKSGLNKFMGTVIYKNMTARNINTVRKLVAIMN